MGTGGEEQDDELLSGFDVGNLTAAQRGRLSALLAEYGVPHGYVGPELQATAAEAELVEDLIAHVTAPAGERSAPPSPLGRSELSFESGKERVLAPRWRRFVAFLVESYLLAFGALGAGLVLGGSVRTAVGVGLSIGSGVVLVALTGRTPGMWLLRIKVVVPPSSAAPGWRAAVVRFAVFNGPGFVAFAVSSLHAEGAAGWARAVESIWVFVCCLPILFDPYRRGLHDRVAATVVIRSGVTGPLGEAQ